VHAVIQTNAHLESYQASNISSANTSNAAPLAFYFWLEIDPEAPPQYVGKSLSIISLLTGINVSLLPLRKKYLLMLLCHGTTWLFGVETCLSHEDVEGVLFTNTESAIWHQFVCSLSK
jgi:hypothetical protein